MKKITGLILLIILSFFLFNIFPIKTITSNIYNTQLNTVFAEDEDEDEDEHEKERKIEDEDEDEQERFIETVITQQTEITYETSLQNQTDPQSQIMITTIEKGYDKDTDKDGLVDAIDPNPDISQVLLFTDSDGDTVPDAYDTHAGEDDLLFLEFPDTNNNGIIDSLENISQ